ncbi:MAG: hypothetical protein IPL28_03445 [Chloroflexi bacterium]|nr:hypothetical protein [Chloroflexota bacterium]
MWNWQLSAVGLARVGKEATMRVGRGVGVMGGLVSHLLTPPNAMKQRARSNVAPRLHVTCWVRRNASLEAFSRECVSLFSLLGFGQSSGQLSVVIFLLLLSIWEQNWVARSA